MRIHPPNVPRRPEKAGLGPAVILILLAAAALAGQDILKNLGQEQDYRSRRVSSYDRSGGDRDTIAIDPGKNAGAGGCEPQGGEPTRSGPGPAVATSTSGRQDDQRHGDAG